MSLINPTLPKTMQAARFFAPSDVRLTTVPCPAPQAGELVITINAALTCGTDVKCYRRGHPVLLGDTIGEHGSPFGHEGCGTVIAVGEGVTAFKVGDSVVAANSAPCGSCFFCEKNQPNLCSNIAFLNGTYAEYLTIPANIVKKNTHKLPDGVLPTNAAFTEPLAVALRGVMEMNLQPGDTVALLGIGPIGLLMANVATQLGAHVTAYGRSPLKRELATTFAGAKQVIHWTDDVTADAMRAHNPGGYGFDAVIEAVGLPEIWQRAVQIVRKGGKVNLFGGCPGGSTVTFDTRRLHYDEITLLSLFHHTPSYIAMAVEWLSTGKLDPSPLITQTMPLSQTVNALEAVIAGKAVKVALIPDASVKAL